MKKKGANKDLHRTLNEILSFVDITSHDLPVRFHTSRRLNMCFLSAYLSEDKEWVEIDIGSEAE